jgi:outer membrane lipoprotein-sorting protein
MKKLCTILLLLCISFGLAWGQAEMTGEQIIRRALENEVHETSYIEGRMTIQDRFGTKVSTFNAWAEGEDNMLLEFTSVEEEGQKILRTDGQIYLFYPDAAELIRIQGSALRDSLLGSDFSYEDMTGGKDLLDSYRIQLLGTEQISGKPAYKVEMTAKSQGVAYPKQILWIDAEEFVTMQSHKFSLSGKLLKEMEVLETTTVQGKTFPSRSIMRDTLKTNSSTEFEILKIELGTRLPAGIFSLEELSW